MMEKKVLQWKDQSIIFIQIQGGSFDMGGNSFLPSSLPVHSVQLSDFWISPYLVTQAFWQSIMGNNPSFFKNNPQYPVEQVSWQDTQLFINQLNQQAELQEIIQDTFGTMLFFDLPTEAQWEYVAQAGSPTQATEQTAWFDKNSLNQTQMVGTLLPNAWGVYDMCGNVWEWCKDFYKKDYYNECSEKQVIYNPYQYIPTPSHVIRGGSFKNSLPYLNIYNHLGQISTERNENTGFRLVLS